MRGRQPRIRCKMRPPWPVLLCWACLMLAACNNLATTELGADDVAALQSRDDGNLKADADALVRPLVDAGHTPGVVAGVLLPGGSMRFFGYGVIDKDGGGEPDGDTLFAVGSLSKGFLAATAALLVDQGIVSWNDRLETLLPPATRLSDDAKQVTLIQLATHTSGMPRQPLDLKTLAYFVRYLFTGESFYQHFDQDYMLDYLATFEASRRGEQQYSNIGYGVLGDLLARRTGLSAEALVERQVVQPLGLRCTAYVPEALPCYAKRAHGYAGDQPRFIRRGDPTPNWQFTDVMRASAGLWSNARELLTMARAHLKGADSRFNAALAGNTLARGSPAHRAAVAWLIDNAAGREITYQVGFVAGYASYIGLDIANGTAVVLLQNSFNWDIRPGPRLLLRLANRAAAQPSDAIRTSR
jgi:CubicO group peptidase (beta-lactamase class C family)